MTDFPAAHSMDTDWFAVDESGMVARFESGEAGAVPIDAANSGGPSDPSFDYAVMKAYLLGRILAAGRDPFAGPPEPPPSGPPYRTPGKIERPWERPKTFPARLALVVEGDPPSLPEGLIAVRTESPRVYLTEGKVKSVEWPPFEAIAGLRDVVSVDDLWELLYDADDADGFFHYGNNDYGVPGAYDRTVVPERPVRLEELPALLQREFSKPRLPVKFAETTEIQLADYFKDEETVIWGDVTLRGEPPKRPAQPPPASITPKPQYLIVGVAIFVALLALLRAC